jgi:predicted ferric reductase
MYLYAIGQIIVALFAVVGIYFVFKVLIQGVFKEKNYIFGIEILTQRDAESAEVLIRSALCQYFIFSGGRYALLTTEEIATNEEIQRLVLKYGLEIFIIKKTNNR